MATILKTIGLLIVLFCAIIVGAFIIALLLHKYDDELDLYDNYYDDDDLD